MSSRRTPLIVASLMAVGAVTLMVFGGHDRDPSLERFESLLTMIATKGPGADPALLEGWHDRLDKRFSKLPARGDWDLHFARARYHALKGKIGAAFEEADLAAAQLPEKPDNDREQAARWEVPAFKAKLMRLQGDAAASLKLLDRAWKLNPHSKHVALGLSESHFALANQDDADDRLAKAEGYANEALRLGSLGAEDAESSTFADAWNQRGVVRLRRNDLIAARSDFLQAIRLSPRYPQAHYNLALCAAMLSADYAKPNDDSADSYRSEALRAAQELQVLDPGMHARLWQEAGFSHFVEGIAAD